MRYLWSFKKLQKMRYKFTLKLVDPLRNILPVNYQFGLGSWFHRMVGQPDAPLYPHLLMAGYVKNGEPFRNFVFSHLLVPDRKIESDRLLIRCERIGLIFSTIPDQLLAPLVKEVFQNATLLLGDKISQVSFRIESVERLPEPEFTDKMTFKTLSPLHLARKVPGRKNELFLSPEDPGFTGLFYENLHRKFSLLNGFEHPHDPLAGKFKLRSPVTQKGMSIQSGTAGQTRIIGYQLRFRLQADPALIKAGYYLGFGEKNSLGFGCCESL